MKATILGLIAGSLFGTIQSSERLRPDLRHWSQDLYQSAPVFEDFEDFLSDLDLRDDPADLEAAQKKRTESLKALESIDLTKESRGRGYVIAKQMVELSLQISSFLRMQEERKFYYASNQWRLQNPESLHALPHEGEIEQNSLKAVGYARNLVNNYDFEPDYGLYILIRLLGRTRNTNMLLFHEQFKQRFQTSKYTHLVEQIVAEYYFNLKQWDKAEPLLKQVIASKNPQLRPYAIYKLAWVHIMRADKSSQKEQKSASLDQAQIALRLCLKLMKDWDFYQPVFDLKNEVAKDLALLYAEQRTPNIEVAKYFSDNDFKTSYLNFLRYLAIDTTRDANSEGAKAAFAEYLPMGAEQPDFPQDLLSQIEMFYLTKSFEQMLAAYKNIRELYLPPNAWYLKWHEDSLLFNHGQSQLAQHLVLMAMKIQQDAEKASHQLATDKQPKNASPQKPAYDEKQLLTFSRSFYDLLFEWFPSSEVLDSARYNYALLVFQLGEMEQGIVLLGQVANDPKSKYRRDASYSLVLTAASWDAKQPVPQLPEASQVKSPIPLTQSKALLVEKIDIFVTSWPDAEEALVANYTAAQILFDFGHYEKASKRFDALINKAPKSEQAGAALNTLLSYMVEKSQWEQLLVLCKSYLSNKEIVAAGHRKLIRQTLDYARSQAAPKQS